MRVHTRIVIEADGTVSEEDGFDWHGPVAECKGGSAPTPPDPAATVAAQSAANRDAIEAAARYNYYDIVSPYGNVNWIDPGGFRTQVITPSPSGQRQLALQNAIAEGLQGQAFGQLMGLPENSFTLDGLPNSPDTYDFSSDADRVEQATFDRALSLLGPIQEDQRNELTVRGLPSGGEAYNRLLQQQNRDLGDLALQSVGAGRQEQSRLFGLEQATRQQALNERLLERTQAINEIAAALQGSPALQTPGIQNQWQAPVLAPDVIGATYASHNAAANNYAQQNSNRQGLFGGLLGLGGSVGAAAILSDERTKTDIKKVGELPLYQYRYKDEPKGTVHQGLMARDVEENIPEAAMKLFDLKAIDYAKIEG